MIVDCHTHIWETPQQLGKGSAEYLRRQTGNANMLAQLQDHFLACDCVDKTFVLGFISGFLGAAIPNRLIVDHVQSHPEKLIGFAGLDPLAGGVMEHLAEIAAQPEFRGITLSPAAQDFHPAHSDLQRVYAFCQDKGLLILVLQGAHFWQGAKMEFARPHLWDEVLRDFPNLRMIIAHLGHPWAEETLCLLGKHPNLYADIAGLIRRPWHAYNSLVQAHQYAVTDKLLFGSDFPFLTASEAIECLYRLNEVSHGTMLPAVPSQVLRNIVERDTLAVLGIERPGDRVPCEEVPEPDEE